MNALLNKTKPSLVPTLIYQLLLLTNDSVSRVVLMSILLNIRKKCIISHFAFALKSNPVLMCYLA